MGLRQELPYVLVCAGLTACAALALRVLQPRRKRPTQARHALAGLFAPALRLLQPGRERTVALGSTTLS
jgi:hypothetical protein